MLPLESDHLEDEEADGRDFGDDGTGSGPCPTLGSGITGVKLRGFVVWDGPFGAFAHFFLIKSKTARLTEEVYLTQSVCLILLYSFCLKLVSLRQIFSASYARRRSTQEETRM
jgi:hypothetical protein